MTRTVVKSAHARRTSNDNRQLRYAAALALRTADAYSADRYVDWTACASVLERTGYTERQAEMILRSRVMRWAADHAEQEPATADDLMAFMTLQPRAVRATSGVVAR